MKGLPCTDTAKVPIRKCKIEDLVNLYPNFIMTIFISQNRDQIMLSSTIVLFHTNANE